MPWTTVCTTSSSRSATLSSMSITVQRCFRKNRLSASSWRR
jgi:hypothetical protein